MNGASLVEMIAYTKLMHSKLLGQLYRGFLGMSVFKRPIDFSPVCDMGKLLYRCPLVTLFHLTCSNWACSAPQQWVSAIDARLSLFFSLLLIWLPWTKPVPRATPKGVSSNSEDTSSVSLINSHCPFLIVSPVYLPHISHNRQSHYEVCFPSRLCNYSESSERSKGFTASLVS